MGPCVCIVTLCESMGSNWNRMEQTRESFQNFFRYFRELSQVVQKNSPKKFPGSFPNFSGNFPQCNTAYRKYVSLYSKSSIENVHCRIVQMTKSNRKLQCIAYTHFEMFLLFCVSCKFLQSMRSRQNRICSANQMLSKDYASNIIPKVNYLDFI